MLNMQVKEALSTWATKPKSRD